MLYVALAEALAIVVVAVSFSGILRWQLRQSARREDLLVNQLCNLAGRPWQEPPAWHAPPEPEPELEYLQIPPEQFV